MPSNPRKSPYSPQVSQYRAFRERERTVAVELAADNQTGYTDMRGGESNTGFDVERNCRYAIDLRY